MEDANDTFVIHIMKMGYGLCLRSVGCVILTASPEPNEDDDDVNIQC